MKFKRRVMYTSILVLGCVLLAWPNSSGHECDAKPDSSFLLIQKNVQEEDDDPTDDLHPLLNLLPSCNLVFH